MTNIEEIKDKALPILKRYGVTKAALFGSFVRREMKDESDIDILVEIQKDISLLDFVGLKLELEETLGRKVDVVEYSALKPILALLIQVKCNPITVFPFRKISNEIYESISDLPIEVYTM